MTEFTTLDALTALTATDAAGSDKILIDDVSATGVPTERSMTLSELLLYAGDNLVFNVETIAATNASYTPDTLQAIILDDVGDDTDNDVTMSAALATGSVIVIFAADGGATGHSVVLGGSQTWDGTNTTAVFNAAEDYIVAIALSATRVLVFANNSVTFSA